jgi:hypothetical protein
MVNGEFIYIAISPKMLCTKPEGAKYPSLGQRPRYNVAGKKKK